MPCRSAPPPAKREKPRRWPHNHARPCDYGTRRLGTPPLNKSGRKHRLRSSGAAVFGRKLPTQPPRQRHCGQNHRLRSSGAAVFDRNDAGSRSYSGKSGQICLIRSSGSRNSDQPNVLLSSISNNDLHARSERAGHRGWRQGTRPCRGPRTSRSPGPFARSSGAGSAVADTTSATWGSPANVRLSRRWLTSSS